MSSSLIVEVCEIKDIISHDNADSLEIAVIKGWESIVKKDSFKAGDTVVYIPVDSILPVDLAERLGVRNYLAGKNNDRVRCTRLRGEVSYGLIIANEENWEVGTDVKDHYGIQKYDPPVRIVAADASPEDPLFDKFTDIENIKNFPDIFQEGEKVVVTEKIDGCFRFDQKISLANGEQIPISDIKIGDMVLSYNENEQVLVPSMVEKVITSNKDKEWVKLYFDNNREIICTVDHLFLTKDRNLVEAQNLTENDELIKLRDF